MTRHTLKLKEIVLEGALLGALVWLSYGTVEYFFATVVTAIHTPGFLYAARHWPLTLMLATAYLGAGLCSGALAGLVLGLSKKACSRADARRLLAAATLLVLIVAFCLNLLHQYSFTRLAGIGLIASLALAAIVVSGRAAFAANPWTISAALLAPYWVIREPLALRTIGVKIFWGVTVFGGVLAAAFLLHHAWSRRRFAAAPRAPVIRVIIVAAMFLLLVAGSSLLRARYPLGPQEPVPSAMLNGRANVLLITMDSVRADHLSLYGYHRRTTPQLKKLAAGATVFRNVIATSNFTLPTHASLFTGMYPSRHEAMYELQFPEGRPLADRFQTLAEVLADKGYLTAAVVANYGYLAPGFHLDQGFQYYEASRLLPFFAPAHEYRLRTALEPVFSRLAKGLESTQRRAESVNRSLFSLLAAARRRGKPFFLFANYMDAHWPYSPPPPFDTMFPGKDSSFNWDAYIERTQKEVLSLKRQLTEREHDHLVSQYDGGIAYFDYHLGELFAGLKQLGMYDNTLIVVTSDHGEAFGERNFVSHGVSLYEDQLHVPLIIKYPGVRAGGENSEFVSEADVMPTILDALGFQAPPGVQGQSLLKPGEGRREIFAESYPLTLADLGKRFQGRQTAIFAGPLKLIVSTRGERELYDLSKDPGERLNLYSPADLRAKALEADLASLGGVGSTASTTTPRPGKEALQGLKGLGYIQ